MAPKSKIESSKHYDEILGMIKEGLKAEDIEDYLKSNYDEHISSRTIRRYVKKIRTKTNQKYYDKKKDEKVSSSKMKQTQNNTKFDEVVDKGVANKEAFDEVVAKGVSDLESLDNIITEAKNLKLKINNIKPQYHENYHVNSEVEIERLKIQAKRLAIQAVKTKADILKTDPGGDDNIKYLPVIISSDEEEKLREEIEDELQ
ncbi:MAG: hypothetical protein LBM02_08150 [Lachnospiraceae bacterium]|jgi:hypothetical protein|nr:hypothetical protein [Lachnospiraceae bacterium]